MNVLISRTDAIGDLVLTLPMIYFIKKKIPEAKIYLVTSPRNSAFAIDPMIEDILVLDPKSSLFLRLKQLSHFYLKNKINRYFFMGGSSVPTIAALFSGIFFRGGVKSRFINFLLLNKGIRQKRSLVEMHEAAYNLKVLAPLGIDTSILHVEDFTPVILISEEEKETLSHQLKSILPFENYFVIHPGMTGHTLNWPVRNYVRLMLQINRFYPQINFVVTSTKSDEKYMRDFHHELSKEEYQTLADKIFFYLGDNRPPRLLLEILSEAKLFIGPSTGPMHLATALKTKVVALFSPIATQSRWRWGPLGEKERMQVLTPDVVCGERTKCLGASCPYFECMPKIEVKDVFNAIVEIF